MYLVKVFIKAHISTHPTAHHFIKRRRGRRKKGKRVEKIHSHHIQHKRKCDDGWGDNKLLSFTFPG